MIYSKENILTANPKRSQIATILQQHTLITDSIIKSSWINAGLDTEKICVYATGGYARNELFIHSDIDLMILYPTQLSTISKKKISQFITVLWDMQLKVSHYIASYEQVKIDVANDLNRYTNFLELRWISGTHLKKHIIDDILNIRSYEHFYHEKSNEIALRHNSYGETSYLLEPNIKESPGGLRDIQAFAWLITRYNYENPRHALNIKMLLTDVESIVLQAHYTYLCYVRWHLHLTAKHNEERLLFEHQKVMAKNLNYEGNNHNAKVESFMHEYYFNIKQNNCLLDILTYQIQKSTLCHELKEIKFTEISSYCVLINGYLDIIDVEILHQRHELLFVIFQQAADIASCKGFTVNSIRYINTFQNEISASRNHTHFKLAFLDLIKNTHNLEKALRFLHRYNLLGAYISDFHRLTGRMQFDLFHVYTVDKHLLMTVKIIDEFNHESSMHTHPLCYKISKKMTDKLSIRLAGLFHDIGKGLRGDHSIKGAKIVTDFCHQHQLNNEQVQLIAWLVENHLLMSLTAQKQDIYTSEVIEDFARKVQNMTRLNHLYLLTVADVIATNPKLWNDWKASLLRHLYFACLKCFSEQNQNYPSNQIAQSAKQKALYLLHNADDKDAVETMWQDWPEQYFLRYEPIVIAQHTREILQNHSELTISVRAFVENKRYEIFIYMKDKPLIVCNTTHLLDKLGFSIAEAQILTTKNQFTLDTYVIFSTQSQIDMTSNIKYALKTVLNSTLAIPKSQKHLQSRRQKQFIIKPEIIFENEMSKSRTRMLIIAKDQVGLLANIANILAQQNLQIQHAKITTMGERVEDVFYITESKNYPLQEKTQIKLRNQILDYLGENNA